jgi:hypothetical protein
MIRTAGFEAESLIVVTDNIDKFIEDTAALSDLLTSNLHPQPNLENLLVHS